MSYHIASAFGNNFVQHKVSLCCIVVRYYHSFHVAVNVSKTHLFYINFTDRMTI